MNDYFGRLKQELGDAVERKAHRRWYSRMQLRGRSRAFAVVIAALVIATPAFGAVAGWFKTGAPDQYPPVQASAGVGKVLPHGDRMLPIRVADPDGGPPWGLRLVRTSRGDTCVQLGRVENGELGSLGIDGAWHNDHLFHPIEANDVVADVCGSTDAAGDGFANQTDDAMEASAEASVGSSEAPGCNVASSVEIRARLIRALESKHPAKDSPLWQELQRMLRNRSTAPLCPQGGERLIMVGLLGPDATSVTYRTAAGTLTTERTVGAVGAYLIVERSTPAGCSEYGGTLLGPIQGCGGGRAGGGSVPFNGVVTKITYQGGRTCRVAPPSRLAAALRTYETKLGQLPADASAARKRLAAEFRAAEHMNVGTAWTRLPPRCPLVGWVNPTTPVVTAAEVRAPLAVRVTTMKRSCYDGRSSVVCKRVNVSFVAREAVTSSESWYQLDVVTPHQGGDGTGLDENIRAGQRLHFNLTVPIQLKGVYHGMVIFMPDAGKLGAGLRGPMAFRHGGLVVGRFSFRG